MRSLPFTSKVGNGNSAARQWGNSIMSHAAEMSMSGDEKSLES